MEAVRYIALNWSEDQCRKSKLRRVLPWRRKSHGSRPGVRGAGPRGPERGDTDQWIFPKVVLSQKDKTEIIGTVLSIAVTELFKNHFYTFGGEIFHQKEGGPIGLRGTCAIARLCMQLFDVKWERELDKHMLRTWLIARYMDDGRACMPPLKPGWRWKDGSLLFCMKWEREDQELSGSEITRRGLLGTLKGVEDFLDFTMEIGEDFEDKWLPTLDTKLWVNGSSQVLYSFYEKPTSSNMTVQRRTAMGEQAKIQVVSNDLVRRLLNNSEDLGRGAKVKIVDDYAQKLANSGYRGEQLRKIITNGIKGYEGKVRRCREQGTNLHRTSVDSQGARVRKKLLARANWFKSKKRREDQPKTNAGQGATNWGSRSGRDIEIKSVIFVEQSPGGELARRIRETTRSMEHILGFWVKVAERTGCSLGSKFSLTNLWDGAKCGCQDCVTCEQGMEELPPCTRMNLVYENICTRCNPGAKGKGEQERLRDDIP